MIPSTILFIHHGKGLGGAPLSLLYLIKGLDRTRYTPLVLFLYDSEIIALYQSHGIETIGPINLMDFPHTKIWWLRWYHVATLLRSIKDTVKTIFFTAPRILEEIKPDIVHLNTSSLIAWAIAAHRKKIPVSWHIREPLADGYLGLRRWLIRSCVARYASAIIPICNNDAKPWPLMQKTSVVYNAVDAQLFCSHDTDDKQRHPIILFLGGLSQEKGTHIILEIFIQLLKIVPNARLNIAGYVDLSLGAWTRQLLPATRYKKYIISLLEQAGASVTLLGPIHKVPAAMAASSVIVFPATVGHFARPVIEAGFMRKPVVASDLAPLDELIVHEKTGFLIDPHNHRAWIQILTRLLNDTEYNQKIGQEAYDFCTKNFNLEHHVTMIQNIYTRILTKGDVQ